MKTMQKTVRIYNAEITVKSGKEFTIISPEKEYVDITSALKKDIKAKYEKENPGKRVVDIEFILSEKSGLYKFPVSAILPFGTKIKDIEEADDENDDE